MIREVASRFGVGDKALPLLQMLLARMTGKDTGGLGSFLHLFADTGAEAEVQSWLGNNPEPKPLKNSQVEAALGAAGGLLSAITERLPISRDTVTAAIGYLIPPIVGKLTPTGSLPDNLPDEVTSMSVIGQGLLNAPASQQSSDSGGGMGWLPWALAAGAVALGVAYCNTSGRNLSVAERQKQQPPAAAQPAPAASAPAAKPAPTPLAEPAASAAPAPAAAAPAASAAPAAAPAPVASVASAAAAASTEADEVKPSADAESGVETASDDAGRPTLRAYFASGKSELPAALAAREPVALADVHMDAVDDADGRPMPRVFFGSGKSAVPADFAERAAALKTWLDEHKGATVAISGFNDPTGDAAANAQLSRQRARAVRDALTDAGIDANRIELLKPKDATDSTNAPAQARRVEVSLVDAEPADNSMDTISDSYGLPMLRVYFGSGKSAVPGNFADVAATLVSYMKDNADVQAHIAGFNDPTGNAAANERLSRRRAEAVRNALAAAGVDAKRMLLEKPAAATDTTSSHAHARRVEVRLSESTAKADKADKAADAKTAAAADVGAKPDVADNLPMQRVYFDTGKAEVPADLASRLDEIKAYLDDNSAASVAISGYNDTTGDAAANAALARERAEAVRDALVAAGIPAGRITLDKPRQATESKDTLAESRRVDVRVTQK